MKGLNMELEIKKGELKHTYELLQIYQKVARLPDGIIRKQTEINEDYIKEFLGCSIENGIVLIGLSDGKIVGEIHAYTPSLFAFQHILTDLTIVVDPNYQGKGIGRKLFESFLNIVLAEWKHIKRVELYTREHNHRNVRFYESLGFINEGRQRDKIFISESEFNTPIHMVWFNPNYGLK